MNFKVVIHKNFTSNVGPNNPKYLLAGHVRIDRIGNWITCVHVILISMKLDLDA